MRALIDEAKSSGKHTMIAAVDDANQASIRLHQRLGFTEVAHMPEIGEKFGRGKILFSYSSGWMTELRREPRSARHRYQ